MFEPKPCYNVCIAKVYQIKPVKKTFTQVGVAWAADNGSVRAKIDITIVLGPEDEIYLFPRDKNAAYEKAETESQ